MASRAEGQVSIWQFRPPSRIFRLSHIRTSSSTTRILGVPVIVCSDSCCFRDPVQGKADQKGRAFAFRAFALDRPSEILDDAVNDGEAETRVSLPFRRDVGLEEALPDRLGDAGAVIAQGDLHVLVRLALALYGHLLQIASDEGLRPHVEVAALSQRLDGILEEVDQDLLEAVA